MFEEIKGAFEWIASNKEAHALRAVVISSSSDFAFSAGLDISELENIYKIPKTLSCPADVGHRIGVKIKACRSSPFYNLFIFYPSSHDFQVINVYSMKPQVTWLSV